MRKKPGKLDFLFDSLMSRHSTCLLTSKRHIFHILNRQYNVAQPNRVYAADVIYIWLWYWIYISEKLSARV